ncbi:hypothetical protein CPB83DRAFT_890385 [Crepidotus variabilis]|uniref:Tetraspanin n=1 Tax=Crepidotus variabilis TaxID=179855 RepID=A0A9P6ERD7_9AGAR|nr:hypothetical protein CPB83DRAFT_890385 [Crepidotus variabilis]
MASTARLSPLSDCLDSFPSPPVRYEERPVSSRPRSQSVPRAYVSREEQGASRHGESPGDISTTTVVIFDDTPSFHAYTDPTQATQATKAQESTDLSEDRFSWLPYVDTPRSDPFIAEESAEHKPKVANHRDGPTTLLEDFQSPNTECTAVSTDSGQSSALACIGTPKFTNKWPKPSTLKYLDGREGCKKVHRPLIGTPVETIEEGKGWGVIAVGKWAPAKICLVASVSVVFVYGTALLILASMTWFNAWPNAGVMTVADYDILVVITLSACFLVFTAMTGISGTFLDSRPILAVYTLLMLPNLILILAVGYISYKRVTFNLDSKLNLAWLRLYSVPGKQAIQDTLHCCGFYNSMHDPSPSKRCYLRSPLSGCRDSLFDFEHEKLTMLYQVAFAMAALHLVNLLIALLSSNHVNRRFGKGLTPRGYLLNREDVRQEAEKVFYEGIGQNVVSEKGDRTQ